MVVIAVVINYRLRLMHNWISLPLAFVLLSVMVEVQLEVQMVVLLLTIISIISVEDDTLHLCRGLL